MGHDTFQYLELQYIFFNEAATRGSLPQWLPYTSMGTVSSFYLMASEGLLALTITPLAWLFKNINFLYIFEAGMLFDEFALLLGCVLLARRYFKSTATIVLVSASITYTAVSSTQVWWNFHLLYLVPLILYCFDRALRDASARHLFLGLLISVSTLLGNLPYFAPPLAFSLMIFGGVVLFSSPHKTTQVLRIFFKNFSWKHALAILVPIAFLAVVGLFYKDWQLVVVQSSGRSATGATADLNQFMTYGGYVSLQKYWELVSRYTNNLDNTIYSGLLVVPFAIVAIFRVRSRLSYAFGITALMLIFFTAGTYVSEFFFYFFPFGDFLRGIGLLAPLVKPFLVFYAGFGFDKFYEIATRRNNTALGEYAKLRSLPRGDKVTLLLPVVTTLVIFLLAIVTYLGIYPVFQYPAWVAPTLNQLYVAGPSIATGLFLLLLFSLGFTFLFTDLIVRPKWAGVILTLILLLSFADVYSMKVGAEYGQVPAVSPGISNLFNTYNYNFSMERSQNYSSNSRFATLAPAILGETGGSSLTQGGNVPYANIGKWGALYSTTDLFVYFDPIASVFRTDNMLNSIYQYYTAWVEPAQIQSQRMGFPVPQSEAYDKLSGFDYPKLQVFTAINVVSNESDIVRILSSPKFGGDMIFAAARDTPWSEVNSSVVRHNGNLTNLEANERLNSTSITVKKFSFDQLLLDVNAESNSASVLYYADGWNPSWHAYVNGNPTPVIRTNIGFKSVIIPPGHSEVLFTFGDWSSTIMVDTIELLGILTTCVIFYLAIFETRSFYRLSKS